MAVSNSADASLPANSTTNTPGELARLLTYLNPPQQQYDLLADGAGRLLSRLPSEPTLERGLATYFQLFARGYAIWQSSYHYHTIHEYFYSAYLLALEEGGDALSPSVRDMLSHLTTAMIEYTWCENAIISNNSLRLHEAAHQAHQSASAASELLRPSNLSALIGTALDTYLETNIALFRGLELCAEVYLYPERHLQDDPAWHTALQGSLALLRINSHELYTELRAHYTFATRYAHLLARDPSPLRVGQVSLVLRSIGYMGEDLIETLFHQNIGTDGDDERIMRQARAITGLPITSVRKSVLQDIFQTSLGEEYLDQVVFDLATDDAALTFSVFEGPTEHIYALEGLQIRVARFGSISVEFLVSTSDVSVSHVRVLESLITPHAGRFTFAWRAAPPHATRATMDFVEAYLGMRSWVERVRVASDIGAPDVRAMEDVLTEWSHALLVLSRFLQTHPDTFDMHDLAEDDSPAAKQLKGIYANLRQCAEKMRILLNTWMEKLDSDQAIHPSRVELANLRATADRVLPPGASFGYLTDIAEEILDRISRFFSTLLPKRLQTQASYLRATDTSPDLRLPHVVTFDPNTGWQAIILCDQFMIPGSGQQAHDSWNELNSRHIQEHRDFKGLIIQSREARASLDDWLFVPMPRFTNLATIRSHEADIMVVGENRALLYLPDDPQYLVAQYVASAAIVGDIRAIVLAFNVTAKAQLMAVEAALRRIQVRQTQGLRASRDQLLQQREHIEVFRTHADQILDLIRSYTISKYQDHSELMRAMVRDSGVESLCASLQRNIETLDHFHTYVTELIHRRIEERTQTNQGLITWLLLILSFLSGLSAIDPLASLAGHFIGTTYQHIFEIVLFMVVALTVCVGGILIWLRSRTL